MVKSFALTPTNRTLLQQSGLIGLIVVLGVAVSILPLKWSAVLVGGGIFLTLSLCQPKLGVYALVLAIPFSSLLQINIGGANLGPMEGLLGLMLVSWLLKMMSQRQIIIPRPPLLWPFLILLSAMLISWLVALSIKASLVETIKWGEMLLLYLFMCANFQADSQHSANETRWLIMAILIAGMAQAGLGLYQFIFKVGPEGFLLFGGRFLRAYGTFRQPNPYAGYLGLILPLALSLSLWGVAHLKSVRRQRLDLILAGLASAGLGVMLSALFASQSRGAWLGFVGAATVTVLLKGGRWRWALTLLLAGGGILVSMGALTLLPATIAQRFVDALPFLNIPDITRVELTDANFAILERLAHWRAAEYMWRDHLWLGVGIGNYEAVYPAYAIGRWLDPLGHAHNYLLNLGAETGLIGVISYLVFWVWVIGFAIAGAAKTAVNSLERAILAGSMGIIVHLHIHNLLDNLYVQGMYLHVALVLSLITLIAKQSTYVLNEA
jgi:O-antigen ligase